MEHMITFKACFIGGTAAISYISARLVRTHRGFTLERVIFGYVALATGLMSGAEVLRVMALLRGVIG